jgi:hypothetical protein
MIIRLPYFPPCHRHPESGEYYLRLVFLVCRSTSSLLFLCSVNTIVLAIFLIDSVIFTSPRRFPSPGRFGWLNAALIKSCDCIPPHFSLVLITDLGITVQEGPVDCIRVGELDEASAGGRRTQKKQKEKFKIPLELVWNRLWRGAGGGFSWI